jgi:hypothetical protein
MLSGPCQLQLTLKFAAAGIGCARSHEPAVPSLRVYCDRVVREFRAPASDSMYRSALSNLMSCPEQGVPLLVGLWEAPPQPGIRHWRRFWPVVRRTHD